MGEFMKPYTIVAIIVMLMLSVVTMAETKKAPPMSLCIQHGIWASELVEDHVAGKRYASALDKVASTVKHYDDWLLIAVNEFFEVV